jgi:hypothetical protein
MITSPIISFARDMVVDAALLTQSEEPESQGNNAAHACVGALGDVDSVVLSFCEEDEFPGSPLRVKRSMSRLGSLVEVESQAQPEQVPNGRTSIARDP